MQSRGAQKKNTLLWLTVGLLSGVGLSIGACWIFLALSTWSLIDSEDSNTKDSYPSTPISGNVDSNSDSDIQFSAQIEQIINNPTDFNHVARLYSLIADADEAVLADLLETSVSIAGTSRREAFQSAVVRRFASLNPHAALSKTRTLPLHQQDVLLATLFHEWSILSLDQALDNASALEGRSKNHIMRTLLSSREDLSDAVRRDIAKRLGGESFGLAVLAEERALGLIDEPQVAWNTLVNDGLQNQFRIDAFVRIAVEWAAQDGIEVLKAIADSLTEDVDDHTQIRNRVVNAVAQSDVVAAFEYATTLDEDSQQNLLRSIALTWANTDPAAALKAVDQLGNSSSMNYVVWAIVNQWTSSSPNEIPTLLSNYSKPVQLIAMEGVATKLIKDSPQESLRLIQEWGNAGFDMTSVVRSVIGEWSRIDPNAALDWLLSQNSEEWVRYTDMMETTLRGLVSVDPQRAFEIALKQPLPQTYSSGSEVWVILELTRSDLDKAIELLPKVRETSKQLASIWIGEALVRTGKPLQALELAEQLPEDDRDSFYYDIVRRWADHDTLQLFESIESLASKQLQSNAAKGLIWNSRYDSVLSMSQLEEVRSYLTEEHAEQVERWRDL
ncbi:MAG: hypothetical protein OXG08_03520 [Gammaproteobacteria bacterium]|nr:hypothetical protein [Gammaproteobacteria bacterium]